MDRNRASVGLIVVYFADSVLAAVLILAAVLKGLDIQGEQGTSSAASHARWALIAVEFCVGTWLMSGFGRRTARLAATVGFLAFAVIAGAKAIGGETDCGCFGRFAISPAVMAVVDLAFLSIGLACRRTAQRWHADAPCVHSGHWGLVGFWTVIIFAAAWVLAERHTGHVFEADGFLGRPLPFLTEIRGQTDLRTGHWRLVFVTPGCNRCQDVLQELERRRFALPDRVVVVTIGAEEDCRLISTAGERLAQLDTNSTWLIETPLVCVVENGRLISVER